MNAELEKLLTRFLLVATAVLEKQLDTTPGAVTVVPKAAPAKSHKKKPAPVEAAPAVPVETPTAPAPKPVLKESESLPAALTVAKEYIQRFQNNAPDGMAKLRKLLAEQFKAEKIGALSHENRVKLIALLEAELL